jgi:hypothetical protein
MQNDSQALPALDSARSQASETQLPLTLEEGREFVGLLKRGLIAAQQAIQETPAQQQFVEHVSWRGAELVAELLAGHEYGPDETTNLGHAVQALQLADTYLYPQMELLAHPESARPADLRQLMRSHASQLSASSGQSSAGSRVHREAAARAVLDILTGVLEASPAGFRLDASAVQEIRSMTNAFDVLYPVGL